MNRKSRKKQTKDRIISKHDFTNEVIGICTIAVGLIFLVGIQSSSGGTVGDFVKFILTGLFSNTTLILPYLIVLCGIFIFINKSIVNESRTILFCMILFISITILKSLGTITIINSITASTKSDWVVQVFKLGNEGIGGGVIGASITSLLVNLFGIIGAYIIVSTILIISLILYSKISLLTVLINIKSTLISICTNIKKQIMNFIFIPIKDKEQNTQKKVKHKSIPIGKDETSNIHTDEIIEHNISIHDSSDIEGADVLRNEISLIDTKSNMKTGTNLKKDSNESGTPSPIIIYTGETGSQNYEMPSIELLSQIVTQPSKEDKRKIKTNAKLLEDTLLNFGVEAKVIHVTKGPTITRYELQPSAGVKVSKIVNLSDDIALNLAAQAIRIEAPIPGKAAIGIEIPNEDISIVTLREVIDNPVYKNSSSNIPFALGKDVSGTPIVTDISKMPHLLIAGATGSGKSVCINTLILSILYNSTPDTVRLLLIDPKVVELNQYNGIPHLLIPVVTDPKKATSALNWAVQEMSKRYKMFAEAGARDIDGYNNKLPENKIPYIVIIIDELADLMMVAPGDVEDAICRLAQMARAAGLHLIIATQRPSVDVITGIIKANIPSRIAFSVASQTDSRTILDMGGAEKLLGKGDMLFYPVGASKPVRIQGAYISEKEIERVITFIKDQVEVTSYEDGIIDEITQEDVKVSSVVDELFNDAVKLVVEGQQASISMLQRRLRIGYNRAARLIDEMEAKGFVGPHEGSKPRQVLINDEFYEQNIKESI